MIGRIAKEFLDKRAQTAPYCMRADEEEIERQKAMLLRKIARFQKAKNHL